MSWESAATVACAPASAARDAAAKEQAKVRVANLRTLADECEAILTQADGFSLVATWLPDLGRCEFHLARATQALAAAAGLVAKD
jgi:hypothetical protein